MHCLNSEKDLNERFETTSCLTSLDFLLSQANSEMSESFLFALESIILLLGLVVTKEEEGGLSKFTRNFLSSLCTACFVHRLIVVNPEILKSFYKLFVID